MTQRHWLQNDGIMLITTITAGRKPIFNDPVKARTAIDVMYSVQQRYPFFLFAFAIMPDHCHLLCSVPEHGSISRVMHAYKRGVSFELQQGAIWQPRFDCRIVKDHANAMNYIHHNPVKKGLCAEPQDYLWSSASGKWDVTELDFMGGFSS